MNIRINLKWTDKFEDETFFNHKILFNKYSRYLKFLWNMNVKFQPNKNKEVEYHLSGEELKDISQYHIFFYCRPKFENEVVFYFHYIDDDGHMLSKNIGSMFLREYTDEPNQMSYTACRRYWKKLVVLVRRLCGSY